MAAGHGRGHCRGVRWDGAEAHPGLGHLLWRLRPRVPDGRSAHGRHGVTRDYGINPYGGYDALGSTPFLFNGTIDPRLDGLARVIGLGSGDDSLAVPFAALAEHGVANVQVGSERFVVLWGPGTASALDDTVIATSEDVGAAVAYVPTVGGEPLTFTQLEPGSFRDAETGSTWDVTGLATAGPLAGQRMEVGVHTVHFWFAWAAFHAGTEIWAP